MAFDNYGHTLDECPYDKRTQEDAWNFWVHGNYNAQGKARARDNPGPTVLWSTAPWSGMMATTSTEFFSGRDNMTFGQEAINRLGPAATNAAMGPALAKLVEPRPALSESTPKMPPAFDRKLDIDFPPTEKDSK